MYKCTDCGQEYRIKPEYCDCGNNIFEEYQEIKPEQPISATPRKINKLKNYDKNLTGEITSWLIFSICIILSVLTLLFLGNGKTSETDVDQKPKIHITSNIPSIDELWVENNIQHPVEEKPSILQTIFNAPVVPKIKIKPNKPEKPDKVQNKQPNRPAQYMTEEQKNALVKRLTKTEPTITETTPKVDEAALRREYTAYKTTLRNTIAATIDFASIIGDGKCSVTFRIDKTGNLIERKFSLQSDNNSLNDVVYNAMMRNPAFQPPPEGYKNETLTFTVKMYGGNFEVTLN